MKIYPTFNSFPKGDPNDNGLNNAAILTFSKDVLDALVKELTQNSIDALSVKGTKLKIRIRMESIARNEIPNIDKLDVILGNMIKYWEKDENFINFFLNAKKILNSEFINVFVFEDYNTVGLLGDCEMGTFKSLVIDEGVSDKDNKNALGGFGIGKNAYFAFTALQTVFYSSYNENEGTKFMGVTKLAEYRDEENRKRGNRVYYGEWKSELPGNSNDLKYLSDNESIPEFFRRKENGLSSFAIGVEQVENWQILAKQAVIRNYWFLLENDLLEVEIGEMIITKSNYFEEAKKLFIEDKSILSYIETFRNPQINEIENIIHIENIKILINEAKPGDDYPNKIVFIRDGMMIKEYLPGVKGLPNNISGIMYCESPKGNEILGKMEPPSHNDFFAHLITRKSTLTEKDGLKIIKGISEARLKWVRKIKEKYNKATSNVVLVDELLNGVNGVSSDGSARNSNVIALDESFNVIKKDKKIDVVFDTSEKNAAVFQIESTGPDGNKGTDGGAGSNENNESGGVSGNGNRKGDGSGGNGNSSGKGKRKKKGNPTEIKASIFFSKNKGNGNSYKLIVYSNKDLENTELSFTQYGDSGASSMSSVLRSVNDASGNYSYRSNGSGYVIEGIKLKKGIRNVFEIEFDEAEQSAFKFNN
jgi:hypothetical protein